MGLDHAPILDLVEHRVEHGNWSYTYVVAAAPVQTTAHVANGESDAVEWVALDDVEARHLHPALASEWPTLRQIVRSVRA